MIDLRITEPDILPTTLPDPSPTTPAEALEWLGGTVEEVVEGLRARGIKGSPRSPWNCPLAHYLMDWFPHPAVAGDRLYPDRNDYDNHMTMPYVAMAFEAAFDSGAFPDLIAD